MDMPDTPDEQNFDTLKKSLKKNLLRDFGDVYRWFYHREGPGEKLDDLEREDLGYDCPPFTGVREMAEVVLRTGFVDEPAA
ncbi:MAG: hypothetical protein ABEK50_13285 [bacterium]